MVFMDSNTAANYLGNYSIEFNFAKSVSGVLPQVIEQDNYDSTNSNKVVYDGMRPVDKFQALNLKFETAEPNKYRNLYVSVVFNFKNKNNRFCVFYSSDCKWANTEFGNKNTDEMINVFKFIFELLDKYKVDPKALAENLKTE